MEQCIRLVYKSITQITHSPPECKDSWSSLPKVHRQLPQKGCNTSPATSYTWWWVWVMVMFWEENDNATIATWQPRWIFLTFGKSLLWWLHLKGRTSCAPGEEISHSCAKKILKDMQRYSCKDSVRKATYFRSIGWESQLETQDINSRERAMYKWK